MSGTNTDPFLWDIHNVVQVFCAPGSPWTKDVDDLTKRIQEYEMDGWTLLTYSHLCSREELVKLLGIRPGRGKAAFEQKIIDLRAESREYRSWYRSLSKKQAKNTSIESDDDELEVPRNCNSAQIQVNGAHESDPMAEATPPSREGSRKEEKKQAPKRRRLEPTNISARPLSSSVLAIPTAADGISRLASANQADTFDRLQEINAKHAYIGVAALPISQIKSARGDLTSRIVDYEDGSFSILAPNVWPRGQRLIVSRFIRDLLRKNGRLEAHWRQGGDASRSSTPSSNADDKIVDFDNLPEFDEETLREIEEEEQDKERHLLLERYLPSERVQAIIEDEITLISKKWQELKLWKHERKAYQLWTRYRREGSRTHDIIMARRRASDYETRLNKLVKQILQEKWHSEEDVRRQAGCLEQSVEDKMHQLWLSNLLESRTEPVRPQFVRRPQRPAAEVAIDPSEDVLTSDEEVNENAFIVNDERVSRTTEIERSDATAGATPVKAEKLARIDLTQTSADFDFDLDNSVVIDLTASSPIPAEKSSKKRKLAYSSPPPIAHLEAIEEICSVPSTNHWGRRNDRWRLALHMLASLNYQRRSAVYSLINEHPPDELMETSVLEYCAHPFANIDQIGKVVRVTANFDFARILLSFMKCKYIKEPRITPLTQADEKKLRNSAEWMDVLCEFLLRAESKFPHESQIYRTDQYDDELDELVSDAAPTRLGNDDSQGSRRTEARQIIRDKAAVDLREREKKRAEDQEARRLKLRSNLANEGTLSQDRSRLIINESKEEDQSLIYINDEISKSIKDHQIEGVRFLWNQIVTPPENRQGCLLSHTMGLGKTMQVITLLVAIAEASQSPDSAVSSQIPSDLRDARILVLCPSGLVDNWIDELLKWVPERMLGHLSQLDAATPLEDRPGVVQTWAEEPGVLVTGYPMFSQVLEQSEEAKDLLLTKPTIVIADEAHMMKNSNSKARTNCSRIHTKGRIALTGSPLANNVEEYYSMIDWVAQNYLGPLTEFRDIYARPIQAGLYKDSMDVEKRRALKLLQVLRETVAPKVHRATVKSSGIQRELPPKREFVITVQPTAMQRNLYALYINGLNSTQGGSTGQARIFSTIDDLQLICNHPRCFQTKLLALQTDLLAGRSTAESFPISVIPSALREIGANDVLDPCLSHKAELLVAILDEAKRLNDKVLVFSQSIPTLDYLTTLLQIQNRRVCRLDGKTAISKRQDMVKDFNRGYEEVYLISTTAGGIGLNIQGANRVVIFDTKWNPVNEQQAVGRAYRLGQQKQVFVYHFMVGGTYEQVMHKRAVFKTQLASRVVDSKHVVSWSNKEGDLVCHLKDVVPDNLSSFLGEDEILDRLIHQNADKTTILSILSTDTFEEEDPNFDLTDEEQKEANDLIIMNRLRTENPKEWERRKGELQERLLTRPSYPPYLMASTVAASQNSQFPNSLGSKLSLNESWVPSTQSISIGSNTVATNGSGVPNPEPREVRP
jgi:SNF2 family DNA or RNA helicase